MESIKRKNNIEICRIFIMYFIVIHHCIVSGLGLNEMLNTSSPGLSKYNIFLMVLNSFVIISVNVFFLISGYFGIRFNKKKIVTLLLEIAFCSMLIYIILVITGLCEITIKNLIKYSLLSINYYWFAIVYIILVMISPALNCIWEYVIKIKEKRIMLSLFILLCIICFIFSDSFGFYLGINNGYSFAFSSYLYFVGRMIRRHEDLIKQKLDFFKSFIGYLISVLLTSGGGTILLLYHKGNLAWKLFSYNSPAVFIGSILFFVLFLNINESNKILNFIGKFGVNVFGVYLLHSMPLIKPYRFYLVEKIISPNNILFNFVVITGYCFLLYIVCLVISRLRYNIFKYFKNLNLLCR